jgi:hypothetical protein
VITQAASKSSLRNRPVPKIDEASSPGITRWARIENGYYLYRLISFVQRSIKHISVGFAEYQLPGDSSRPARDSRQIDEGSCEDFCGRFPFAASNI